MRLTRIDANPSFQILDVFLEDDGRSAPADLRTLAVPADMDWRRGVVISGKAPIWVYAHLTHQCHIAAWVATYDPRLGGVVVQAHSPGAPAVGSVVPTEEIRPHLPGARASARAEQETARVPGAVVAFLGPPHSGKSVLLNTLRLVLPARMGAEAFQRDFFIVRACPDGEGDWFSEIPADQALTLRYKARFDERFVTDMCDNIGSVRKEKKLVLVDCGGKIDRKNQRILNCCTHALVVSNDPAKTAEWRGAAAASGVATLAEVESTPLREASVLSAGPLRLRLGPLERGAPPPPLPGELVDAMLLVAGIPPPGDGGEAHG
jgi:CRISPR-associated protein Csx3